MNKLVIFDLDGTLTDTLDSLQICANEAVAAFGCGPYEKERFCYFAGDGMRELVKRCLCDVDSEKEVYLDQAVSKYQELFAENCMYHVEPYEGIKELLGVLKKTGAMLAVNSNKPHSEAVEVVETIFGKDCFDMIVGNSEERPKKPSPEGIHYIMKTLGVSPQDVLYLGDTDTDMKTGKNAGVFTIGVLWGFRKRAELEENGADAIIAHPLEALIYLQE